MEEIRVKLSTSALIGTLVVAPLSLALLAQYYLSGLSWQNERLHSLVDGLGAYLTLTLAVILLFRPRPSHSPHLISSTTAVLFALGVLYLLKSFSENSVRSLWLDNAAVLSGGLLFVTAWLPVSGRNQATLPLFGALTAVVVGVVIFISSDYLPAPYVERYPTSLTRGCNLVGGLLFVAAGIKLFFHFHRERRAETALLATVALYVGAAAMLSTIARLWGVKWWLMQALQLLPFVFGLLYLLRLFLMMQRSINESEQRLSVLTDELRLKNDELEKFSSIVSHDLRSPLNTIVNFVGLIQRKLQERDDKELLDFLSYAKDGATKMRGLIDDLLALSKSRSADERVEPIPCGEVVGGVLDALRNDIETSGARITVADLPTITADRPQLTQLFQNLIGNAIKFHGDAPPIVLVEAHESEKETVISVRDNGIGLKAEYATQIFEPFKRLHSQSEFPGTGLGLSICKSVVERHRGRIWVESAEGQGSTFFVAFPKPAPAPLRSRAAG